MFMKYMLLLNPLAFIFNLFKSLSWVECRTKENSLSPPAFLRLDKNEENGNLHKYKIRFLFRHQSKDELHELMEDCSARGGNQAKGQNTSDKNLWPELTRLKLCEPEWILWSRWFPLQPHWLVLSGWKEKKPLSLRLKTEAEKKPRYLVLYPIPLVFVCRKFVLEMLMKSFQWEKLMNNVDLDLNSLLIFL